MDFKKIIQLSVPSVPMWAMYVSDEGLIYTTPIVSLALVEGYNGENDIYPIPYSYSYLDIEDGTTMNYIGLCLEPNPKAEDWKGMIEDYFEKVATWRKNFRPSEATSQASSESQSSQET